MYRGFDRTMPLTKAQIHRLRQLREKKHRESQGLFVVENEKVLAELLESDVEWTEILATEAWSPARGSPRCPVERISPDEMARISHLPTPGAVLAVGRLVRLHLRPGELATGRTLALDGVQDAGNVGTLLRIADWFAFDRVLLSPTCADLFSQKVINASMGSFARMRAFTLDLALALRESGGRVPVLGCDLAGQDVYSVSPHPDVVVVIGSEGRGLSPEVTECLSGRITIPRFGRAESLNAAVAAGIVCGQLTRDRPRAPEPP